MKQTIIIHGMPSKEEFYDPKFPSGSNFHWLPWLQKQLNIKDELSQALEFPRAYDPIYKDWVEVFEQMELNEDTNLIGHSCGGGFLLRYLSEHPDLKVAKVFLIAPWWIDIEEELGSDKSFFDFKLDTNLAMRFPVHIFMSSDEDEVMQESFRSIKEKLPEAIYHEYTDRKHFCTPEFPELLALL